MMRITFLGHTGTPSARNTTKLHITMRSDIEQENGKEKGEEGDEDFFRLRVIQIQNVTP